MDFSEPDSEFVSSITLDGGPSNVSQNTKPDQEPTVMAICTDGTRCGSATYSEPILNLVADRRDPNDPYKGLDLTIQKINPEVVIVSAVQKKLIAFLEKRFRFDIVDISKKDSRAPQYHQAAETQPAPSMATEFNLGSTASEAIFTVFIVPNFWFCMSRSMQILFECELVKSKKLLELEEKSLFITSKIEKSVDVCAIRAISAVNAYLIYAFTSRQTSETENTTSNTQSTLFLQSNTKKDKDPNEPKEAARNLMPIIDIRYLDPGPVLSIDKFTFESLAIFHQRSLETYRQKEEVVQPAGTDFDFGEIPSLYEVLNQCISLQGKKHLHTMMLWPLQDMNELNHRHDVLDYFIRHENKLLVDQLLVHLKSVVPLASLLAKLNQSVGTYKELSKLYKSLWAFMALIDIIKTSENHNLEIFNRIGRLDSPEFRAAIDSIVSTVDFEASMREKRVQILLGVNENHDQKKEMADNLSKFMTEVEIEETAKYKDLLDKPIRVIYIPRIGFLASVDFSSRTEMLQIRSLKEFNVLMDTEKSIYFKTPRMEKLDENAGDVACDLIDMQEAILVNLQDDLLKHTDTILRLMELCGELDCLVAFAKVSLQRGYVRPEFIAPDDEVDIQEAYHPLHCIKYNIIPNNVRFYNTIAQRKVKLMVLTGPNSCGKTTYMKASCLVIYMAHIGCFVPARSARIPLFDAIYTRMHSANSISTGLSSFATDLHQLNYAMSRATERSLIAIDEFGKGTQARDGFYLLKGLVAYFATRTQKSPYVMVTTHFNRLISHLQNYSEYILYNTFKVSQDLLRDSVVYEYRLMEGVGEDSLADKVAARAGVPQKLIDRANQIRSHITGGRARPPSGA